MKLPSGLVKYAKLLAIARGSSLNLKRRLKPAATFHLIRVPRNFST